MPKVIGSPGLISTLSTRFGGIDDLAFFHRSTCKPILSCSPPSACPGRSRTSRVTCAQVRCRCSCDPAPRRLTDPAPILSREALDAGYDCQCEHQPDLPDLHPPLTNHCWISCISYGDITNEAELDHLLNTLRYTAKVVSQSCTASNVAAACAEEGIRCWLWVATRRAIRA